jgi:NAD(P)-dependent dehydrogenase (short-subunit alcohol dehydrogenase family)
MSELRFDGQVAVVTGAGAAAGLGRAHARLLAARGAKVVVNDLGGGPDGFGIERAHADRVAEEIRAEGGEAVADTHNVAVEDGARAVVQTAVDTYGRIDILVNNAGIVRPAEFRSAKSEDIEQIIDVHLMGNIWMCRAAWPLMIEQDYGRIVNVSSVAMWGVRQQVIYGAAKAGILGLTRGLAVEGAEHGIRVNALAPRSNTTAFYYFNDSSAPALQSDRPPEVVAPVVAYLCHKECRLNASYVAATGGGHVAAGVFGTTGGYQGDSTLTPEGVRDNLDAIVDRAEFEEFPEAVDVVQGLLALKDQYREG